MILLVNPRATRPANRRFPLSIMAIGAALPGDTTWEIIDGNLPVYNSVMSASWRGNAMHQTMIRAWTKLEFGWAIACRMAEAINASDPVTQQMLGEIWSYAELTRSVIHGHQQLQGRIVAAIERHRSPISRTRRRPGRSH